MKKRILKRAAALALGMIMLLSAASCEYDSEEAADSSPDMAYPLLTEKSFNSNGEQETEDVYGYDADGNLTRIQHRLFGEGLEISSYEYENGKLVSVTETGEYNEIKYLQKYEYKYDANGLLEEISESENGEYVGKTYYMRGSSGKIKRVITYDVDNQFNGMIEHKYDAAGNCVEEKEYSAKHIVGRYIYQYDRSGNVTECMVYDEKGFVCIYRLSYNSGGELLRKDWLDENGNCYRSEEYSFDEDGRRKSRTDTKDGAVVKIIYYEAYDGNGSCVKESAYLWDGGVQDDHPAWYVERTYGAEKVPVPAWEFGYNKYHGDFLL